MATFQLFFQSGRAKDLSAQLYLWSLASCVCMLSALRAVCRGSVPTMEQGFISSIKRPLSARRTT